jgi:hypothetical protein
MVSARFLDLTFTFFFEVASAIGFACFGRGKQGRLLISLFSVYPKLLAVLNWECLNIDLRYLVFI